MVTSNIPSWHFHPPPNLTLDRDDLCWDDMCAKTNGTVTQKHSIFYAFTKHSCLKYINTYLNKPESFLNVFW